MSAIVAPRSAAIASTGNESESHISYRADIDGLRAVAVLAVLAFHAFPSALPGGFAGVDIFFVISGFLITNVISNSLEKGTFSVVDFYVRRVRRIFPALAIVLLACLVFGWKSMLANDLAQLAKHVVGGAAFISNFLHWQESGYFDATSETKALLHLWSLGIEEQFYIVWPVLVAWAWRRNGSLALLIGLAALLSFACNVATVASDPSAAFYSPLSRAWELLIGASIVGLGPPAASAARSPFPRHVASIAGACLIALALFRLSPSSKFPGWWALLPTLGAAMLIWAGPSASVNRLLLTRRPLVGVGLVSFPLYLWHWPLLTLGRDLVPAGAAGRGMLLLASGVLAWATYLLIERPLRFGRAGRAKALGLVLLMLLIAGVAAMLFEKSGVPSRYPQIIQNATRHDLDGFRAAMRWKECFLEFEQEAPEFAPGCVDAGSEPMVLLWGDSGAAALYPGFRALAGRTGTFRLAQFTSSACPPMVGFESARRPACLDNNRKALERLRSLQPEVVVLAALWQYYDTGLLARTIAELRRQGIERIIVLGPGLTWEEPPARIVLKEWQRDPLHRLPPARLNYANHEGLRAGNIEWMPATQAEAIVRRAALENGAEFISVQSTLCNKSGCLMRASDDSGESFFLDTAHLNPTGAKFVIDAIAGSLNLRAQAHR